MELDVQHIAGKNNDEADALSRWSGQDQVPCEFQLTDRVRISLSDLWILRVTPQVCPNDAFYGGSYQIHETVSYLLEFQSHYLWGLLGV